MIRLLPFLVCALMVAGAAQADPLARFQGSGKADPIRVGNLRELSSPVAETRFLAFDLAWDHSWRASWEEPSERHGGSGALELESCGEIPAGFPNGFAAFYCMKHQIAPAQYAAFLNMLPAKEAETRYAGKERWVFPVEDGRKAGQSRVLYSGGQGQVLRSDDGYAGKAAGPRAGPGCFGLSWADGAAFAAWSGLRPMSELELEKAVRGPRRPAPEEVGPSYWGIGGFNTWDWNAYKGDPQSERTVTVGNATGRRFIGTHGRGVLNLPADWPQADAVGSGMRCTHYMPDVAPYQYTWSLQRARLSDRMLAAVADPARNPSHKWRGVRTAPKIAKGQ